MVADKDGIASADALLGRLIKLTNRKEDFLTECFAAVLQADKRAVAQYWEIITARHPRRLRSKKVARVRTQCNMDSGAARCDMVLDAGDTHVTVEHKLDSPQGKNQLPRYLALSNREVTHVAFVSADYQNVQARVLNNKNYVRPQGGQDHFVWADFYPVLKRSGGRGVEIATAARGLFDRLGLQPAHPLIGFLNTRDERLREKLDARLLKAWQPLLGTLRRKWDFADSSIRVTRRSEIWADDGPSKVLQLMRLDPFGNPGSLRVTFRCDSRAKRDRMYDRITSDRGRSAVPCGWAMAVQAMDRSPYKQRYRWAVDIRILWRELLSRTTRRTVPNTLKRFVVSLMKVADARAV